ncbi:hypothetical protein E2C01_018583 [Portunus trituberculatus]|uniref:Uncharacterized protein n=1 Tax=Portunus trituberculatus TaxID=210409 RepID=A0A5B7DWJ4_PORTR|nr:hypothetical protein [Portunus trituberculatus]
MSKNCETGDGELHGKIHPDSTGTLTRLPPGVRTGPGPDTGLEVFLWHSKETAVATETPWMTKRDSIGTAEKELSCPKSWSIIKGAQALQKQHPSPGEDMADNTGDTTLRDPQKPLG